MFTFAYPLPLALLLTLAEISTKGEQGRPVPAFFSMVEWTTVREDEVPHVVVGKGEHTYVQWRGAAVTFYAKGNAQPEVKDEKGGEITLKDGERLYISKGEYAK